MSKQNVSFKPRLGRHSFGQRVRTARAYAGISQAELAKRIAAEFPEVHASGPTVQRLETGDPGVKGSIYEWAQRISAVTDVPAWFLVGGWTGVMDVLEKAIPREDTVRAELLKARERAERQAEVAAMSVKMAQAEYVRAQERLAELSREHEQATAERVRVKAQLEELLRAFNPAQSRVDRTVEQLAHGTKVARDELRELVDALLENPDAREELSKKVPLIGFYDDPLARGIIEHRRRSRSEQSEADEALQAVVEVQRWAQDPQLLERLKTGDDQAWESLIHGMGVGAIQPEFINVDFEHPSGALASAMQRGDPGAWLAFARALVGGKSSRTAKK